MTNSQDIEKSTVDDLRKLARQKGLTHVACNRPTKADSNGQIQIGYANKSELLAVLTLPKQLELTMFSLNEQEQDEVNKALEITGMSLLELAKAGLLMKARRLTKDYTKVETLTPDERKQSTLAGAAIANLRATADNIIQWNHGQYNNDLRVYLNASILRNLTGSNLNTIKDFLSAYHTPDDYLHTPDEHNQHYGLTDKDNRKGRDEFGNKIKISELIKQPVPSVKPKVEREEAPTSEVPSLNVDLSPQESFAQRIDKLESDSEFKAECEALMEALVKENGSKKFSSFKKLVTPYRDEIEKLRLHSNNSEAKLINSENGMLRDNWLKNHSELPKGAEFNEQGNIISYPVHIALKYLSSEIYKHRISK